MSRDAPPPLPGGYTVGEKVFFTGMNVHGQQGEVVGPAINENTKGKGVSVHFPGDKNSFSCYLTSVRRLRATSAGPSPAPQTRDAAHSPCGPATASAAAPQPSLHEQPLAPQPTARVRGGDRFVCSAREPGG